MHPIRVLILVLVVSIRIAPPLAAQTTQETDADAFYRYGASLTRRGLRLEEDTVACSSGSERGRRRDETG